MTTTDALVRREWLQHRRAWSLLAAVPLLVAAALLTGARMEVDGAPAPAMLAAIAVVAGAGVLFSLFVAAGLTTAVGLARRDHGDRSIEFWLSLPVSHLRALLTPLAVHLLVVPLIAASIGAFAGFVLAPLLIHRIAPDAIAGGVPWGYLAGAAVAALARLALGWPLALLWLSPLVVVPMLAFAWARRWGLFLLGVAIVIAQTPLASPMGLAWLPGALSHLVDGAARSVLSGGFAPVTPNDVGLVARELARVPVWLVGDLVDSIRQLASPVLLIGLTVAAAGMAALVRWRARGAASTA